MVVNQVRMKKYGLNAILSIALCAVFHCASAQNVPLNSANSASATDIRDANELAERERIAQERDLATKAYAAAKVGCYKKFQVNACLTQARNQHNAQQADLKRQEVGLNDQQRKRRGAEQLQRTEDKTLVQREQEVQRQQNKAQEDDSKRQQRQADLKPVAQNAAPVPSKTPTARPTNATANPARAQDKAAAQQQRAAKAAQAKAASQAKLKEAAERRENAQKRLEKSGKKTAPSLPIPAGS